MKITSQWKDGFASVIDNGRNHQVTVDLPWLQHGKDQGPTALELSVMGYAGCITTVFAMMAEKMKFSFSEMTCEMAVERGEKSITKIEIKLKLSSDASREKIQKAFDMTCNHCPVGVIFVQAGIEIRSELIVSTETSA
ncbi:MAG: OsmC family protein [Bacteroidales bacterium]